MSYTTRMANLLSLGLYLVIGYCFMLELLPAYIAFFLFWLPLSVLACFVLWHAFLADFIFDHFTLHRLTHRPLKGQALRDAEDYRATTARLERIRASVNLPPAPIRGGLGDATPTTRSHLQAALPLVVSESKMRKAFTMADQAGTDMFTSTPIELTAFTSHQDDALYTFLMEIARGHDMTVEQMDDLSPSGHILIRLHATGDDASSRIARLADALRNPINLDDPVALQAALDSQLPGDPPIIAQSQQRHEDAAAAAANANRTTEPPRESDSHS